MKKQTYAIVDNDGKVYAHDIRIIYTAECLIEHYFNEALKENGLEYAKSLELEIIKE